MVQTPSNMTQSQISQTTDNEEIYDSVRSLSQAVDDSLILKKEQARQVLAQASETLQDELEYAELAE